MTGCFVGFKVGGRKVGSALGMTVDIVGLEETGFLESEPNKL